MTDQVSSSSSCLTDCHPGLNSWWSGLRQRTSGNKGPVPKPCWHWRSTLKKKKKKNKLWVTSASIYCSSLSEQAELICLVFSKTFRQHWSPEAPRKLPFYLRSTEGKNKPYSTGWKMCVWRNEDKKHSPFSGRRKLWPSSPVRALPIRKQGCWPGTRLQCGTQEKWPWKAFLGRWCPWRQLWTPQFWFLINRFLVWASVSFSVKQDYTRSGISKLHLISLSHFLTHSFASFSTDISLYIDFVLLTSHLILITTICGLMGLMWQLYFFLRHIELNIQVLNKHFLRSM